VKLIGYLLAATLAMTAISRAAKGYDPSGVPQQEVVSVARDVHDSKRDRDIPVRVYLPVNKDAPVVLFSHGLGGSRDNNGWLGEHWAKRGYFVVCLQHPGSDSTVLKKAPVGARFTNLKGAATFGNLVLRGQDVAAVLDEMEKWNAEGDWKGRMDLKKVGVSGHSFGAHTSQVVAGQEVAGGRHSLRDPRVSAAVMLSPAPPAVGDPAKAFAPVAIPCLLLTGTKDDSPISDRVAADRLKVFPHLDKAPAWEAVFEGAEHSSFGGRGRGEASARYRSATLALTTAFWDATLKGEASARTWLDGEGAKAVFEKGDSWKRNGKDW
jgi:predicted dienelactone hydrolase